MLTRLGPGPTRSVSPDLGAWTPTRLGSKLRLFLDAERASSLTLAGSLVTSWADSSPNALLLSQSTTGFKPSYSATGLNGRPAIVFDGADDYLRNAQANLSTLLPTGTETGEFWGLANSTKVATGATALISTGSSSTSRRALLRDGTSNYRPGTRVNGTATISTTGSTQAISAYRMRVESNRVKLWQNSLVTPLVDAAASGTSATNQLVIGAETTTTFFWGGPVNSIIITQALTDEEAGLMMTFLKTRGGIA